METKRWNVLILLHDELESKIQELNEVLDDDTISWNSYDDRKLYLKLQDERSIYRNILFKLEEALY